MNNSIDKKKSRLLALDSLRGFDMFWIIGGDQLFRFLGDASSWGVLEWWGRQVTHVQWEGFQAYDLVFPLFMFISGVAIPFSILKKYNEGISRLALIRKVSRRVLILICLGLVYNGVLSLESGNFRVASVLGQIGIAYWLATVMALYTSSTNQRIMALTGILIVYAGIQLMIPVPGYGPGQLTPQGNINGWLDTLILPGKLYGGSFDPEGILCMMSASVMTLLGCIAGEYLKENKYTDRKKVIILSTFGASLIALALILAPWYPIIKSIWTSTFNLLAGGLSLLLMAVFYLIIDVWGYYKWTFFFRVIGLNSITIYLAVRIIDFENTAQFIFGGIAGFAGQMDMAIIISGTILIEWLFLYFLYKNKIFLKV